MLHGSCGPKEGPLVWTSVQNDSVSSQVSKW
jgi:hypothetical protein